MKSTQSLNKSVSSFFKKNLNNKLLLNTIAIISFLNILGYLVLGNNNAVLLFIIISLLTYNFNKNMIIVLGIPLLIVNFLSMRHIIEGMETKIVGDNLKEHQKEGEKHQKESEKHQKEGEKEHQKEGKKEDNNLLSNNNIPNLSMQPINTESNTDNEAQKTSNNKQGFENGRNKYNIDYYATIEDAYDELGKRLDSDGINRLNKDTQNLLREQIKLKESMSSMSSILEYIKPIVQELKNNLS